tara:strand:- start:7 stop:279 length:273 start_codon:yes stop_codon:yes gene_type:complete
MRAPPSREKLGAAARCRGCIAAAWSARCELHPHRTRSGELAHAIISADVVLLRTRILWERTEEGSAKDNLFGFIVRSRPHGHRDVFDQQQ